MGCSAERARKVIPQRIARGNTRAPMVKFDKAALAKKKQKKEAKRLRIRMEEEEEHRKHRLYLKSLRAELRDQLRRGEIDHEEMDETYGNAYAHIHSLEND